MDTLLQNLRYAFRQLGRNPGFSLVVAVTIALGVGATTAIFSLVDALLLRPLPVHEPHRLVGMVEVREQGDRPYTFSYPVIQRYRADSGDPVSIAAHGITELAYYPGEEPRLVIGSFVTGNYFDLLGLEPVRGRFIVDGEEVPGVPEPVAVISHRLWERDFSADPGVIGSTIRLNSRSVAVIGVAPAGFHGLERGIPADVWLPIPMYAALVPGSDIDHPGRHSWLVAVGRLGDGQEAPAAEAALSAVGRGLGEVLGVPTSVIGVEVFPLRGIMPAFATSVSMFMGLLLAASGLVLLVACANVAGMLLARGAARQRELGIRLAVGAGRGRLVSQLLTETMVLFLMGGLGGILIAAWLARIISALPQRLPGDLSMFGIDVVVDARVVAFGLLLALLTALLFGLAPALRASRPELISSLKDGVGATASRSRLRGAFVAGQVAVCVLLLVSAGLLTRSLREGLAIDLGMDPSGVYVATVNIERHGYDEERGRLFWRQLRERLDARPEIESVGLAGNVPLTGYETVVFIRVPGHEPEPGQSELRIDSNTVGGDYFRTLRIPLEGRDFEAADRTDTRSVAIVNRTMADRFWPGGSAIGQHFLWGSAEVEIVGIAGDGRYNSLTEAPIPFVYLPLDQSYRGQMVVHARAAGPTGPVPGLMRRELAGLEPDIPLVAPADLERFVRLTLLPQRLAAVVVGALGGLGLLLAAVGLFGLLAYLVGQRAREIGIRMALGARSTDVARLVIRHAGTLVLAGLAAGLLLAFAATRVLAGFLVGVSPTDPVTFAAVAMILGGTGLLAAWVPARRAARVDPLVMLKAD
jgi:predicted permease